MGESHSGVTGQRCLCPYCEHTIEMSMPFCKACGAELRFCRECGGLMPNEASVCPKCGAEAGSRGKKE